MKDLKLEVIKGKDCKEIVSASILKVNDTTAQVIINTVSKWLEYNFISGWDKKGGYLGIAFYTDKGDGPDYIDKVLIRGPNVSSLFHATLSERHGIEFLLISLPHSMETIDYWEFHEDY